MTLSNAIILELIKTVLSIVLLFLTWVVGTQILSFWEFKKKQKELAVSTSTKFQELYGEFSAVWRLWKLYWKKSKSEIIDNKSERYWELLRRASVAEGGIEAILVKLASEKKLTKDDINTLGLFRQVFQQLRQSIRDVEEMDWKRKTPQYKLLKELTCKTILIINPKTALKFLEFKIEFSKKKLPKLKLVEEELNSTLVEEQLTGITAIDTNAWNQKIEEYKIN